MALIDRLSSVKHLCSSEYNVRDRIVYSVRGRIVFYTGIQVEWYSDESA